MCKILGDGGSWGLLYDEGLGTNAKFIYEMFNGHWFYVKCCGRK